ncbi:MAG: isoprenylcysteine carboxylmethyltransferase family protein [Bacteroidetes bacterium]|nr:isoprenylcysteine carboxylmethyltransferase family protein [Bacteroidota bacterium]
MESTLATGLILISPILLVRFLLLSYLGKEALKRAAFFPPTEGIERIAYLTNILTTFLLIIIPFFLKIRLQGFLSISGLCLIILALVLYTVSIIQFARPNSTGLTISGLYNISRNPMYVAFFLYFLACCMLTGSWILLIILLVFQISVHFLIISEERWCKRQFDKAYLDYAAKVRRYI